MKLVSDLKQFLILNDFPSVNEAFASDSQGDTVSADTSGMCCGRV